MYLKFCHFPNFTPPTQGLFSIQTEGFSYPISGGTPNASYKIQRNRSGGSGEKKTFSFFTIYGHYGRRKFPIVSIFAIFIAPIL